MTNNLKQYTTNSPTWCSGCGNWSINVGIKTALSQLKLGPSDIMAVFGIGCSGNMNDFLNAYAIHSLHGRAIPTAIGMKIANHQMPVLVVVGDGDCYGEGGNHFLHACRGNHNITVVVHDNRVYGLTTGQVSPTARKGAKSKSTPTGIIEEPLNPLELALTQGATFVSQAFAGDFSSLVEIIKKAIEHPGLAIVNVLQPCITFNKVNNYQYYLRHIVNLDQKHKTNQYDQALSLLTKNRQTGKLPVGVIYQVKKPTYTDQLQQLNQSTLVKKPRFTEIKSLLNQFI